MLRHCIMQIGLRSYSVDHAIYVNSDDIDDRTSRDYDFLLKDAGGRGSGRLIVGYGPSLSPHRNGLEALQLADLDEYDLFLKVDDDDIYLSGYVEGVVQDFLSNRWDYSGTHSIGMINGHRWIKDIKAGLGESQLDIELGVPHVMPPTAAFSRRAVQVLLGIEDRPGSQDQIWRRTLAKVPGLAMAIRHEANFVYNIHGANLSTSSWLLP